MEAFRTGSIRPHKFWEHVLSHTTHEPFLQAVLQRPETQDSNWGTRETWKHLGVTQWGSIKVQVFTVRLENGQNARSFRSIQTPDNLFLWDMSTDQQCVKMPMAASEFAELWYPKEENKVNCRIESHINLLSVLRIGLNLLHPVAILMLHNYLFNPTLLFSC